MQNIQMIRLGIFMRTTLTLDPDAFDAAQAYAKARALRMGQAVSEMIRDQVAGAVAQSEQDEDAISMAFAIGKTS